MSFSLNELREAASGRVLMAERESFPAGAIDSRNLEPGELFFALRGESADGHAYVEAAIAQGAGGAVIADERAEPAFIHKLRRYRNIALVAVDEPEAALARLAAAHRSAMGELRVAAITGSNGKTTTKEILAALLSAHAPTLATRGNLNNQLGVPLTLLRLEPRHQFAVVEIGASGPGEVDALARMVRPKVGILTNIAPAHLEGFGSLEGVRRSKGELLRHVAVSGTIIVNEDDPGAVSLAGEFAGKKVKVSVQGNDADVVAEEVVAAGPDGMSFTLRAYGKSQLVRLPLVGTHNVSNAVMASAAALELGIPFEKVAASLERVRPAQMRSEVRVGADGTMLLVDCYNANPTSMSRALETLAQLPCKGWRIAILGQMNELGSQSREFHRALGEEAARQGIDWLLYTGMFADEVIEAATKAGLQRAESFPSHEEIMSAIGRGMKAGDSVLIKGSRGARMERIADPLLARLEREGHAEEGEGGR